MSTFAAKDKYSFAMFPGENPPKQTFEEKTRDTINTAIYKGKIRMFDINTAKQIPRVLPSTQLIEASPVVNPIRKTLKAIYVPETTTPDIPVENISTIKQ